MTKTRARITGTVKPDIIYSKKVSREAMEMTMTFKRSQKAVTARKGIVYTAKILRKMSKRPTIVYAPFKSEKSGEKKKTDVEKN